jgi:hypothetical protein
MTLKWTESPTAGRHISPVTPVKVFAHSTNAAAVPDRSPAGS